MDRIIISHTKMNVMPDDTSNESEKILELLFEPDNAEILVELKDGPKPLSVLTKKITVSKEELDEKLSFLIEKGFLTKNESSSVLFFIMDNDSSSRSNIEAVSNTSVGL